MLRLPRIYRTYFFLTWVWFGKKKWHRQWSCVGGWTARPSTQCCTPRSGWRAVQLPIAAAGLCSSNSQHQSSSTLGSSAGCSAQEVLRMEHWCPTCSRSILRPSRSAAWMVLCSSCMARRATSNSTTTGSSTSQCQFICGITVRAAQTLPTETFVCRRQSSSSAASAHRVGIRCVPQRTAGSRDCARDCARSPNCARSPIGSRSHECARMPTRMPTRMLKGEPSRRVRHSK